MAVNANLPSLYEYYASTPIISGLSVDKPYFTLNEKNISVYSGAMHYFRVPKEYWRDRLRKMRAAGLNTVETYVPWNLHEPQIGQYDFGEGNNDMSSFLDLPKFLKTAQEEDLFAIVRPGPYICAEWEFGGLPSWLLREKGMRVRTSDSNFMKYVSRYFRILLQILATLQFTKGGPIIAFQVENEYGSTESKTFKPDKGYIRQLKALLETNDIKELLFTSDSPVLHGDVGTLPELFQTANFDKNPVKQFDKLKTFQINKPTMAMEFWTGWFDHWFSKHHMRNNSEFREVLEQILTYPASVNMYMFSGGTNWGFLNGANINEKPGYQPDTSSYDYDAPLSENGNYTEKYHIVKELLAIYNPIKTRLPPMPKPMISKAYPKITIEEFLPYNQIVEQIPFMYQSQEVIPMELLSHNKNSGQSYGYIIYRKTLTLLPNNTLKIKGHFGDNGMILTNGTLLSLPLETVEDLNKFGYWRQKDPSTVFNCLQCNNQSTLLDMVVLNWGRNNFGTLEKFKQNKGLIGKVYLNEQELRDWEIIPIEFKQAWTKSLKGWTTDVKPISMSLYRGKLEITDPHDTFIDMSQWNTGIVIVNNFVLGRYTHLGPQQTLYLPAPLLKKGNNEILVFEHFTPAHYISFSAKHIYT